MNTNFLKTFLKKKIRNDTNLAAFGTKKCTEIIPNFPFNILQK